MAQNLDLNVNVNTDDAVKSVGSLKAQLREAQAEVAELSEKFGATSKEAIEAAKRAGELKDAIGDARALTEAFNPDAKFKALTSSLSGVAGGFAAVQGAMGLLGVESESVEKTLLKVQSAMAISQGLQTLGESIDAFKQLGAVIQSTTIFQKANAAANTITAGTMKLLGISAETTAVSFRVLKTAIVATGIGVLVILLGEAVAAFENFTSAADDAAKAQDDLNKKVEEGAKVQLKGELEFIDKQQKLDLAKAKSRGASEKEIFDIEQRYRRLKGEAQVRYWNEIKDIDVQGAMEVKNEIEKNNIDALVAQEEFNIKQKEKAEERAKQRREDAKKLADEEKEERERQRKEREEIEKFDTELQQRLLEIKEEDATKKRELDFQEIQNLITDLDYKNDILDFDFEQDQQRLANKEAYIAEQKAIELSNLDLTEKERLEIIAKYAQQEKDIDKSITASKQAEKDAQVAMQLQYIDFAAQSGNLLTQIAGKNKSLAIAGLLIEKGAAIAKIITQMNTVPPVVYIPYAPYVIPNPAYVPTRVGGALSIASVIAASAQGIQQINQSGNGGTGSSSVPAMSTQAPITPQLPMAQTTNISRQSINDLGNQAVRAYVIETDVTGNQQRMAAIRQRARFS